MSVTNKAYIRQQRMRELEQMIKQSGLPSLYEGVTSETISGEEIRQRYQDFIQAQIKAQQELKTLIETESIREGLHDDFVKDLEFHLVNRQNGDATIIDKVKELAMHVDEGIAEFVCTLRFHGIETVQSCEGGGDHAFVMPTVDFIGGEGAGLQALGICITHGFPVSHLARVWKTDGTGQVSEAIWRIEFYKKGRVISTQSSDPDWIGV
jgi:hypothetical protein